MCKVVGCKQNHYSHYCRVCGDHNAAHFSASCPKGTVLYHGTKRKYAQSILNEGFTPSDQGRIGGGVYCVKDYDIAKKIAEYKFGSDGVVIMCIAEVDYTKFNKEDSVGELK